MHKVRIKMNGGLTEGFVEVDDKIIRCRAVEYKARVGTGPVVTIELVPSTVEIEADDCSVVEDSTALGQMWKTFQSFKGGK